MQYSAKRALLSNTIDYAGTFPPAALSFSDALKEAATCRQRLKNPWLVSKMALPLVDLKKVNPRILCDSGSDGTPWLFTALGAAPSDEASQSELVATLEWELREINRFNERGKESSIRHEIVGYETRLPRDPRHQDRSSDQWTDYLFPLLERFEMLSLGTVQLQIEIPTDSKQIVARVADALCIWLEEESENLFVPSIKIRTGGVRSPTISEVAHVIDTVVSRGLHFKATQGLHEAITHGESLGFVNLFAALTLAQAIGGSGFPAEAIQECLKAEKAEDFHFETNYFAWREFQLDTEKIEIARRHHGGCFGSCSVVEPDQSLEKHFSKK